jgi:hypothetical protein
MVGPGRGGGRPRDRRPQARPGRPGDETEIGTRVETPLRDYLEGWGEGTFSAPNEDAETSSSAAPQGA